MIFSPRVRLALPLLAALTLAACDQPATTADATTAPPAAAAPVAAVSDAPAAPAAAALPLSLVEADSTLAFVTIKNGGVAEVHRFPSLTGRVAADGQAEVTIALDAVETNVAIRNERMRTMLFDTANFPEAVARVHVDPAALSAMAVGSSFESGQPVQLALHGKTGDVPARLIVTRISDRRWTVTSAAPLIVTADAFDLGGGIEALREVAKLAAIATAVPVTLSLVFEAAAG